jgi:nucleoside-diphosphate-sugar epimerase
VRFTVLGAGGYIGSRLVETLSSAGHECRAVTKSDQWDEGADFGNVVFAVGLTADFRRRLADTVEAHVCEAVRFLRTARYDSFLYLSSTRVYNGIADAREDARLVVDPTEPEDVYNLSKLMGEAFCLAHPNSAVRVVRLSNVYGGSGSSPSFLDDLLTAAGGGVIHLRTDPASEKDYVHLDDICDLLPRISLEGRCRLYNVAAGRNVTHERIVGILARQTGCRVEVEPGAPVVKAPRISIERVREEFAFTPRRLEDELSAP